MFSFSTKLITFPIYWRRTINATWTRARVNIRKCFNLITNIFLLTSETANSRFEAIQQDAKGWRLTRAPKCVSSINIYLGRSAFHKYCLRLVLLLYFCQIIYNLWSLTERRTETSRAITALLERKIRTRARHIPKISSSPRVSPFVSES